MNGDGRHRHEWGPGRWHAHPRTPAITAARLGALAAFEMIGTRYAAIHPHGRFGFHRLDALAYALVVAGPVALWFRRRYPATVLFVVLASVIVYSAIGYPDGPIFVALVIAFFTAVMKGRRTAAVVSLVVGYPLFLWLGDVLGRRPPPSLGEALGLAAWLLVVLFVATMSRVRRDRAGDWRRIREEESRRRASEERLAIAREIHDVVAHNISLINVQAGVALHLMDEQPEHARTALAAIKDASKETLQELRSVLGVLRRVDEGAPRAPAPGLANLGDLLARAGATGLRVERETEGTPVPLPGGVDLAAFRIVQEALTNVVRHAGAATATVRVEYGPEDLVVRVDDDGRGRAPGPSEGGSGIEGMRERASALGGELEAGPRPGGGFRVRARLPLHGGPS